MIRIFNSKFQIVVDWYSMTSLEVIGAGLGRTSTASLKLALEKLGFNVHHMSEVMRKGDFDQWNKIHKLGMADNEVKAGRFLRKWSSAVLEVSAWPLTTFND